MRLTEEQKAIVKGYAWCIYLKIRPNLKPFYVGKSKGGYWRPFNLERRSEHFKTVVRKYGAENIKTTIISCLTEDEAYLLEEKLIVFFNAMGCNLVNVAPGGRGAAVGRPTDPEESRSRRSSAHKGKKLPDWHKKKLSDAHKGVPTGRSWNKGLKFEDNDPRKTGVPKGTPSPKKGKPNPKPNKPGYFKHSEQTKKKMSNTRKGRPSILKGKPLSIEHRKALSKAKLGKPLNEKQYVVVLKANAASVEKRRLQKEQKLLERL